MGPRSPALVNRGDQRLAGLNGIAACPTQDRARHSQVDGPDGAGSDTLDDRAGRGLPQPGIAWRSRRCAVRFADPGQAVFCPTGPHDLNPGFPYGLIVVRAFLP